MLISGKNVVNELLKNDVKINKIYLSEKFSDEKLKKKLPKDKIVLKKVSEIGSMTNEKNQGIIADVEEYKTISINEVDMNSRLILVLDHLEDTHNFGAIIRTAECAGVKYIIIPKNRSVKVNATVIRTSAGAVFNTKIVEVANIRNTLLKLKENGFLIVGAEADGENYKDIDYTKKTALVIGSEGKGLKYITKNSCDVIASLPLNGKVNSLNASVACAILIYEIIN